MSKRQGEISRFLAWYNSLESDEAKHIVETFVRDAFRKSKPKATRKVSKPKGLVIQVDQQMKGT